MTITDDKVTLLPCLYRREHYRLPNDQYSVLHRLDPTNVSRSKYNHYIIMHLTANLACFKRAAELNREHNMSDIPTKLADFRLPSPNQVYWRHQCQKYANHLAETNTDVCALSFVNKTVEAH